MAEEEEEEDAEAEVELELELEVETTKDMEVGPLIPITPVASEVAQEAPRAGITVRITGRETDGESASTRNTTAAEAATEVCLLLPSYEMLFINKARTQNIAAADPHHVREVETTTLPRRGKGQLFRKEAIETASTPVPAPEAPTKAGEAGEAGATTNPADTAQNPVIVTSSTVVQAAPSPGKGRTNALMARAAAPENVKTRNEPGEVEM